MPEFADDLFSIDVIGFVKKYCRSHQKKNPISVSTDGVLGRPNNWRSLDSRANELANAMPILSTNFPYQARQIKIASNIGDLPIHSKQNAPAQRRSWVLYPKEKPEQLVSIFWP